MAYSFPMTRKHFEAIARIIATNKVETPAAGFDEGFDAGVSVVASDLADYLATQNPNFDRQRFLTACGL